MRTGTTMAETSVDRLLGVAAHKIACEYNLPDACKLTHPTPALVARVASVYRNDTARASDGGRYVFDAMLLASQHALKLLQVARGTRGDAPSPAYWALLMAALASIAMSSEPSALPQLETFVNGLVEDLAQL